MGKFFFGENFNRSHIVKLTEMKKHYVGEKTNNVHAASVSEANDNMQKSNLLKQALTIVDELAGLDIDDFESLEKTNFDIDKLEKLIKKAKEMKKHRFFVLK